MKKSIIAGTIATILGGLVLMIVQSNLTDKKIENLSMFSSVLYPVEINLTGSNNDINLSNGGLSGISQNINILGSNSSREVFIGENQTVALRIFGSNNTVNIDRSVFTNVSISEVGSNNSIVKSVW